MRLTGPLWGRQPLTDALYPVHAEFIRAWTKDMAGTNGIDQTPVSKESWLPQDALTQYWAGARSHSNEWEWD